MDSKYKIILLLYILPGVLFAEMKPLKEFIVDTDETNYENILYINYRCLGLYAMARETSKDSPKVQFEQIDEELQWRSATLQKNAYSMWVKMRKDKSQKAFEENVNKTKVTKINLK